MFSINQEGTLRCNRVGHDYSPIQLVCMKKGCQEPIPCCLKCVTKEHKHQQQEFVQISEVQGQDNSFLEYLNKLAQLCQSISDVCQSWKKETLKLIDQLRQKQQLGLNPTLTELSDYVRRVRERNAPQRELETVQKFQNELQQIQERLTNLQKEVNELFIEQVDFRGKVDQQNVIKQEIVDLNHLEFALAQKLSGDDQKVGIVSISDDDKYLASLSSSYPNPCIVILWDLKSNNQITQYKSQYSYISALQFSKDNRMLGVCSWFQHGEKGFIEIIEIFDVTNLMNTEAKIRLKGHRHRVTRITFTDDSNHLISVSWDSSLRVWDLKQKKQVNQQNCENALYGVTYSHEQQLIVCCGDKGLAYLFDCRTLSDLKLKIKWQAHSDDSLCIEFIRNSTVLMTSSSSETRFWQVDDLLKQKFNHFKEIKEGGWIVKAYPLDNPLVAINCSSDKKFVNLWDYNSTELIQRLEIPDGLFAQSFAITSDFRKIITGGSNKMVHIFEKQEKK